MARRPGACTGLIVDVVDVRGRWRYFEHLPAEVLVSRSDVDAAAAILTSARMVVLQLQQPPQALLAAAGYAQGGGGRVVFDGAPPAGPHRDALLAVADVLRADTHEAELLTGVSIGNAEDAVRAGRELLGHGPELVVLGAGEAGNAVVWDGGAAVVPLLDVDVVDSTGAGDAFTAGLVAELLGGTVPQEAGRLATAAAALAVGELGGRPHLTSQGLRIKLDALANHARHCR